MRVGQHVVSLPSARKETVARVVRRSILFIQRAAATLDESCVFWLLFGGGGAAGPRAGGAEYLRPVEASVGRRISALWDHTGAHRLAARPRS